MFKNVASKIALFAFDTTTGAPKTGDAANLTAYVAKDYGTTTVSADTSATEQDATNAKGWYLFDLAQGETNGDALLFTGKSSTANVSVVGQLVFTTPNRFSSLVIDAAGLADANAVKMGPTGSGAALTARDVGANVLLSSGTGAGQLSLTSGLVTLAGVTHTGAIIPTVSVLTGHTAQTGDSFARLGAPAGASVSADVAVVAGYVDTEVAAIKAKTDNLPVDPADASDVAAAFSTVNATLATIASYIDTEVGAIKAKTDNLPASPAAVGSAMTLSSAYDFAKGTVAMTESYATDGAAMTPVQVLHQLWSLLAESSTSSVTVTTKKLDGSTTAMTLTTNSATTPTSITRAT